MTMDWTTLSVAMGSAWLSGVNLYATVGTLGLLQKFGWVKLPGELGVLSNSWVLGVAGVMYAVEFFADKIPAVDSAWDAVHTFIRVPAGAILAATAFADFDPTVKTIAMIVGGGVALGSHGLKATTRLAANTSPEPFSNIALSVGEDIFTFGGTLLMTLVSPVAMLVIVVLFLILLIWLVPKIYRTLRRLMFKLRSLFGSAPNVVES
jgi:ABC-type multidrug transport system fused ATPase/permease subunit